jgi:hypothetical protein
VRCECAGRIGSELKLVFIGCDAIMYVQENVGAAVIGAQDSMPLNVNPWFPTNGE